jgi:hypothetical protein
MKLDLSRDEPHPSPAAGLQARKLTFAAAADPRTLVRRMYLVIHGFPPTPGEVREFLDDAGPGAVGRLVDRVLVSPRYGERWARHCA